MKETKKWHTRHTAMALTGIAMGLILCLFADWKTGCLWSGHEALEDMVLAGDMDAVLRLLENSRIKDAGVFAAIASLVLSLLDAITSEEADKERERWRRKR